jgi:hypothetical protein
MGWDGAATRLAEASPTQHHQDDDLHPKVQVIVAPSLGEAQLHKKVRFRVVFRGRLRVYVGAEPRLRACVRDRMDW